MKTLMHFGLLVALNLFLLSSEAYIGGIPTRFKKSEASFFSPSTCLSFSSPPIPSLSLSTFASPTRCNFNTAVDSHLTARGIISISCPSHSKKFRSSLRLSNKDITEPSSSAESTATTSDRKELWKSISNLEKKAVELLSTGQDADVEEAYKLLSQSVGLKKNDPFLQLAASYAQALESDDNVECERLLAAMKNTGAPPHIATLASKRVQLTATRDLDDNEDKSFGNSDVIEEVDPGSTFSDTVTEKIRVKISSFYDSAKSEPENGKYMFWYKVGIYNEGPEPVQIVARMWEIEKCRGEKEIVRGAGIMSAQPIIAPGDVFTYHSICPLKVFPPKGKRVLGSMSGAYTMCKGNMGQHNFSVKVGKFMLILPEEEASKSSGR